MERLTLNDYSLIVQALDCYIEQKQENVERETKNGSTICANIDARYIKELEATRAKVAERLHR